VSALVSVVIPVYNRSEKILEAVASVQAQTCADWEMILVDDGSKDNTPQVLRELQKKDHRIQAIFQENRGAQAARNAGIRAAKGEWVAFLDSDDVWLPRSLDLRMAAAERDRVSVVHSEGEVIDADGYQKKYGIPAFSGNVYKELLRSEGPMFQALLARKSAFEKINFLDESIVAFQEWDTAIRLAKHYRFGFEPESTFVYDRRGTDTISKQMHRGGVGYGQILKKHGAAMLFLTGPYTLIRHYDAAAGWYERGADLDSAMRCRRIASLFKCLHPISLKNRARKVFRRRTSFMRALPDFMIIGAQKAGTTSLFEDLMRHPRIKRPLDKELHYFSDPGNYQKGLAWYRSQFPIRLSPAGAVAGKQLTGEATPYYLFHPLAPQRIFETLPRVKLIVMLRDPVDRAFSHYFHEVREKRETRSFEQAIENEPAEMEQEEATILGDGRYFSYKHRRCSYLSRGIYWRQLERWFKFFERSQFVILKSEDYLRDPEGNFSLVADFLGLFPHRLESFKKFHEGVYDFPMQPETREGLKRFYKPHNEKLSRLLGRDLGWD